MFAWLTGTARSTKGDAIVVSSAASRNASLLAWSKRYRSLLISIRSRVRLIHTIQMCRVGR